MELPDHAEISYYVDKDVQSGVLTCEDNVIVFSHLAQDETATELVLIHVLDELKKNWLCSRCRVGVSIVAYFLSSGFCVIS